MSTLNAVITFNMIPTLTLKTLPDLRTLQCVKPEDFDFNTAVCIMSSDGYDGESEVFAFSETELTKPDSEVTVPQHWKAVLTRFSEIGPVEDENLTVTMYERNTNFDAFLDINTVSRTAPGYVVPKDANWGDYTVTLKSGKVLNYRVIHTAEGSMVDLYNTSIVTPATASGKLSVHCTEIDSYVPTELV